MFASKRKNDEKPKGLPRSRLIVVVSVLMLVTGVVFLSLIIRTQSMPNRPTGHLFYNSTSGAYDVDFATGQRTLIDFSQIPKSSYFNENPWSPDGTKIAMWNREMGSAVLALYHSSINVWTQHVTPEGRFSLGDTIMGWSTDGQWVIFAAIPIMPEGSTDTDSEIWRVNIVTRELEQLTDNATPDMWPSFSRDGTKIAYTVKIDGFHHLAVMDLTTRETTMITPDTVIHWYSWAPDGNWLAYMTETNGSGDIWIVRADGSEFQPIAITSDYETYPVWEP